MNRTAPGLAGALIVIPILTLGLVTWACWSPTPSGRIVTGVLATLAGATALTALAFALDGLRIRRAFVHLRQGGGALSAARSSGQHRREQYQDELVVRLRRKVERLSAIRDLALIANDDIDLERILERALEVLGGLLDAREITIYLLDGPERDLEAVAHRLGDRIRVRGKRPLKVRPKEAARALEACRTVVEAGRGAGTRAAALLRAEGELMGALEVRLGRGLPSEPLELARELEALAKHIALAIRKPTLYDRAVVDSLTKLYTKRHFTEQVDQHIAQRRRLGTPLSLIILDVDHFKRVNDEHGHVAGDLVLAEVANRVKTGIRAYDQAFRYGGEEVVVLAPNTKLDEAVGLAERLRTRLRRKSIDVGEARLKVTASFGVAEYDPDTMVDLPSLIEAADQQLYRAKRGGRDRVESARTAPEALLPAA